MSIDPAAEKQIGLQIRLFGQMEVEVQGSPLPALRSRKGQWLLALLVLNSGHEVERVRLAGLLWPDTDETAALGNLRRTLTDLRRALGAESVRIDSPTSRTLRIDLDGAYTDVVDFDSGIRNGDIASLRNAVALYRGELLSGCAEEWVTQERAPREEEALAAFEALAEDALQKDNPHDAVKLARRAASINPWRESLQRCLLRALSADGDHAGLIVAFREFREALQRDLNARPDPETVALFTRLRSEARVHAVAVVPAQLDRAALRSAAKNVHLPHSITPLIGRGQETADVLRALRQSRLVTLTGAGGVGKTCLAIHAAAQLESEYPEGIWFVALGSISDPRHLIKTVAAALEVEERSGASLEEGTREFLRSGPVLLVLDNCEHLQDSCRDLAHSLLESCPDLRILATSRHALGEIGETTWRVPPLSLPDSGASGDPQALRSFEAVSLFEVRASASEPRFALTPANTRAVVKICSRLDGIPLAIELAAARVKVLPVEEIAKRLDESLRILSGGSRSSLPHQQTLNATMDWSYSLLSAEEQKLLGRLSIFAGGCTLLAAHQVCGEPDQDEWDVLDLLSQLADKSLLVVEESPTGEARYRLLETVRQYGMERLQEDDSLSLIRDRHFRFFFELSQEAFPQMTGPDQAAWGARLEADHPNLRIALEWATDAESRLRMATNLVRFWQRRGHLHEGRSWVEGALRRQNPEEVSALRGLAFGCICGLAMEQGDLDAARQFGEESVHIRRKVGDPSAIGAALNNLANAITRQGDDAAAQPLYEEALELMDSGSPSPNRAIVENNYGLVLARLGDLNGAEKAHMAALEVDRAMGNREDEAGCLNNLARLALVRGDFDLGRRTAEEALAINREVNNKLWDPQILITLSHAAFMQGQLDDAAHSVIESIRIAESLGVRATVEEALEILACIALERGSPEESAWLLGAAEKFRAQYGQDHLLPVRHSLDSRDQAARLLGTQFDSVFAAGMEAPFEHAIARAVNFQTALFRDIRAIPA